jgi:hypothetical protein
VLGVLGDPRGGVSYLARLKIAVSLGGIILNIRAYNRDKDDYSRVFKLIERYCVKGEGGGYKY